TWRREHHRSRERRRMQEELDDARKIQLSMLPRSDPHIPWLDVAGISVPASEVGGDYYDYFTISESREVIVVGDVAGHGVASGLLLSGIRSCLHLLQETPLAPAEILAKLDRMVRQTTGRRMFVTLLYALFDHAAQTLTLAAAGHPPLLRFSAASGLVEEFATPALPLGTGLDSTPREITLPFQRDDIFLLYTDGIAETLNARGELYGDERLRHRLSALPHERNAKEIRDMILGDVWSFKADGEQLDDITVVVAKVRLGGREP
ncbi:MAG: PP2C family protein-serine/threonine phosphatase, partial [bacterium]|nr:PP2C family protein-serine/threonine phosphatase [bacterium]